MKAQHEVTRQLHGDGDDGNPVETVGMEMKYAGFLWGC